MTIACVLRSGGDFDASWVHALKVGVEEHGRVPRGAVKTTFLCLTDMEVPGVETLPLVHGWPGWWSKMELFKSGLVVGGLVLYMDLDTLPVGPLDTFTSYLGEFAMINDFYRGRKQAQSGVMLFRPGKVTAQIWEQWIADPEGHMQRFRGDGEWLHAHTEPDRLQDLYPGKIHSLKVDAKDGPPEGCALVCGHGRPRFTDPKAGWAHQLWKDRTAVTA